MTVHSIVVGIAGGSGAGKTTLVREILERLPAGMCQLLDHDSYYRDLSEIPFEERQKRNFDHPSALETELLCQHVALLRSGHDVEKPIYNFSEHTRLKKTTVVTPSPVLIVEGILVLADESLRTSMDLRLFVDAPPDLRLLRRIRRDILERGRDLEMVLWQYESMVRPMYEEFVGPSMQHADLIVPALERFDGAVSVAVDTLRQRVADSAAGAGDLP